MPYTAPRASSMSVRSNHRVSTSPTPNLCTHPHTVSLSINSWVSSWITPARGCVPRSPAVGQCHRQNVEWIRGASSTASRSCSVPIGISGSRNSVCTVCTYTIMAFSCGFLLDNVRMSKNITKAVLGTPAEEKLGRVPFSPCPCPHRLQSYTVW